MPNNKMERFTQRARRVLSLAQEQAERLHHNTIGTEHMLLGLLIEEGGIAGRVLRDLGLETQRVQGLVEELTRTANFESAITPEISTGCKRIIELSVDEARRLGHHYIGTEHLLLGLARMTDGVAIDVLKRLGVSPEQIRRQTRRVLQESPAQAASSPQTLESSSTKIKDSTPVVPLPADLFEVLENVLVKILEMIKDGKVTVSRGVELFSTLVPDLKIAPIQQAQLITQFFALSIYGNYKVRVTPINAKLETVSEANLALSVIFVRIDRFIADWLNELNKPNPPDLPLIIRLTDIGQEIQIEKRQDQS